MTKDYKRRYRLPDPTCLHKPKGYVTCVSENASTVVCDRTDCIEDAKAWVYASTHEEPIHVRYSSKSGGSQENIRSDNDKGPSR